MQNHRRCYRPGGSVRVFRLRSLPNTIVSDRGPQFASAFWERLCNWLGIDRRVRTALHPEIDGPTKRASEMMEQYLRAHVTYLQDDWSTGPPSPSLWPTTRPRRRPGCRRFSACNVIDRDVGHDGISDTPTGTSEDIVYPASTPSNEQLACINATMPAIKVCAANENDLEDRIRRALE